MLLGFIKDAKYTRDVTVIDIPNAFIQKRIEHENIYGYHNDRQCFGGHANRYFSRCLWTICKYVQEVNQATDFPRRECSLWNHCNKSTVLLKVL